MLAAFWSGLGGELAKQWTVRILTPAFAFWAGGLALLWWRAHGAGVHTHGWAHELTSTATWVRGLPGLAQGLLLVAALLVVAASAVAADRLTLPVLRLQEGYWSRPRWLRRLLVDYRRWRHGRWAKRVDELSRRQRMGELSIDEYLELAGLEAAPAKDAARLQELRRRRAAGFDHQKMSDLARGRRYLRNSPRVDSMGMPTRLGDVLRAAERRPADKYGLDATVCWYALWLLLPAEARTELVQVRSALDSSALAWLWGVLFVVWTPWTWWALPIGLGVASAAYYFGILGSASLFGELTVAAFDLYRFRLYDALHLPRPSAPQDERREAGPRVTNLLWGGLDDPGVRYVDPPSGKETTG
jgi:hypothetical protein